MLVYTGRMDKNLLKCINRLETQYGIPVDTYNKLYEAQQGLCSICKTRPIEAVDHCHETNKARGLLCSECNGLLGFAYDDVAILQNAIEYLNNPPIVPNAHDCVAVGCPGELALNKMHNIDGKHLIHITNHLSLDSTATVLSWINSHHMIYRKFGHLCGLANRCPGKSELIRLYSDSQDTNAVGTVIGVSGPMARKYMESHEIPRKRSGPRRKHVCGVNNHCPGESQLKEWTSTKSYAEIGSIIGTSAAMVTAYIKNYHSSVRPKGNNGGARTKARINTVVNYDTTELTLAKRKISRIHVCGVTNKCPGEKMLQAWYNEERKSIRSIVIELGVDSNTFNGYLKQHSIDRNRSIR